MEKEIEILKLQIEKLTLELELAKQNEKNNIKYVDRIVYIDRYVQNPNYYPNITPGTCATLVAPARNTTNQNPSVLVELSGAK